MHRFNDIRQKFNAMKKESQKSRGLGDSIEKFTKATGIKAVVDKVSDITGKDCGCGERRDALNRVFPYSRD